MVFCNALIPWKGLGNNNIGDICTNQLLPQQGSEDPDATELGQNDYWLAKGCRYSRLSLNQIFFAVLPLDDHRMAAHPPSKLSHLFFFLSFSCSLAKFLSCLLILFLLLMSSNVHPDPAPLPLFCVRWQCNLEGKVSAMLYQL